MVVVAGALEQRLAVSAPASRDAHRPGGADRRFEAVGPAVELGRGGTPRARSGGNGEVRNGAHRASGSAGFTIGVECEIHRSWTSRRRLHDGFRPGSQSGVDGDIVGGRLGQKLSRLKP